MLLLAATTTLYGTWVFFTLGRLLDPDNEDDEMDDEDGELSSGALHAAVILFRIWALCTTIVAGLAVRGLLQVSDFPRLLQQQEHQYHHDRAGPCKSCSQQPASS